MSRENAMKQDPQVSSNKLMPIFGEEVQDEES
jgi:hypothetical protein